MAITLPPDLEPLATDVALRAIGAAPDLVLNQLREAIREFCIRSTAWREYVAVTTIANIRDYALSMFATGGTAYAINSGGSYLINGTGGYRMVNADDPPVSLTGAIPVWIMAAVHDGRLLGKWSPPYGSQTLRWGPETQSGRPAVVSMPRPDVLRVWPRPDREYVIAAEVAVTPSARDVLDTVFPSGFLLLHHDAIVSGALSRLYMMPNTPFAAPALAERLARAASRGATAARVAAEMSGTRGLQPTMSFPRPAGSLPA